MSCNSDNSSDKFCDKSLMMIKILSVWTGGPHRDTRTREVVFFSLHKKLVNNSQGSTCFELGKNLSADAMSANYFWGMITVSRSSEKTKFLMYCIGFLFYLNTNRKVFPEVTKHKH